MTFKDVVLKNIKGSSKKYLAYFLSSSFSIFLFFDYSVLILSKDINKRDDTEVLSYVFPITMVAIALFSIFFINYAHSAFIKGRNKEFGIYFSLGMNSKEIKKLINIENIIICAASLLTGIGVGALFSRFFTMIIMSLLDITNIRFSLDYKPFLLTVVVFLFIFITVVAATYINMRKMDISSLLREARKSEGKEYSRFDFVFGALGIFIMAMSVVFLIIIAKSEDLISNPFILMLYMGTAFIGVYLTLSYGGNLIFHLLKGSRYYYKNMLFLTQLNYKFGQNKKIIFILSVLSTMTIFLVASPFSLFSLSETIAEMDKNHLEYVETGSVNKLSEDQLNNIIQDKNLANNSKLKFIFLSTVKDSLDLKLCKPVISIDEYNQLTKSNLVLNKGEAYNVVLDWRPGVHGINPGSIHELYAGGETYRLRFVASERKDWITGVKSFPSNSIVVMNTVDYKKMLSSITEQNVGYYHLIQFKNWKKSKSVVIKLKEAFGNSELKVCSIIDTYHDLRKGYSVFLFVSTVMGILFFISGGSVLYFKQYTELPDTKAAFYKLYKVGINYNEMKKIIGKELFVVFFLPLLFGTFLGVSLIYLMTHIVGGEAIMKEFLTNASVVVAIYFLSQGIFYIITRNKYMKEISVNY